VTLPHLPTRACARTHTYTHTRPLSLFLSHTYTRTNTRTHTRRRATFWNARTYWMCVSIYLMCVYMSRCVLTNKVVQLHINMFFYIWHFPLKTLHPWIPPNPDTQIPRFLANTNSNWDWICTEEFACLDLVDCGGVAFAVESVISTLVERRGLRIGGGNSTHRKVVFCICRCQSIWVGNSGDNLSSRIFWRNYRFQD